MADDEAPAGPTPTVRARVGWAVVTLGLVGLTLYLLWQGGSAIWDAAVLAARGETVSARVVEVDLNTKLGMPDELVVLPGGATVPVEIATRREDIGVGAVVDVVVDPDAPDRAALASDGWPWLATLMPLFLAPWVALSALVTLGPALGVRTSDPSEQEAAGEP
ncbi:DUF3592 domain-containing protein [Actinomycetospora aeridis]|uniref:DUF3592 domain-containing protein n=1 Tax=Actinomycetospora aeridis TaxID=3129231 RepID=A0ABU8NDK8_9PSEU